MASKSKKIGKRPVRRPATADSLQIEWWPIDKPIPYARNARKIPQAAIDKVAASIQEFGFRQPLVVDGKRVIIAGHVRLLAAQKLERKEVPVHVAEGLTPAQVRAYRLMDNRSHQEAEWDLELLGPELRDLNDQAFDLLLTGFNLDEIDGLLVEETEGLTDEDAAPPVPEVAITVSGDLWVLGSHRLLCGDSTSIDAVERLMDGQKADMVVTDPPYNVDYEGGTAAKLKIQNDKMSEETFAQFLRDSYMSIGLAIKPGAAVYIFYPDRQTRAFHNEFERSGFHLSCVCVWRKQSIVLGRSDYHAQHEPVIYGWKDGASHGWYGDRCQSTIWDFDRPTKSTLHPTMKPVAAIEHAVSLSSKTGDLVLDLFGGSGSAMIACEKMARSSLLMELDPKYCDVIVKRWQDFTGKTAVLDGDGRSFNEISEDRKPVGAATAV